MPKVPAEYGLLQVCALSLYSKFRQSVSEIGESLWRILEIFPFLGDASRRRARSALGSVGRSLTRPSLRKRSRPTAAPRAIRFQRSAYKPRFGTITCGLAANASPTALVFCAPRRALLITAFRFEYTGQLLCCSCFQKIVQSVLLGALLAVAPVDQPFCARDKGTGG
jgi:hypothetical protein